MIYKASPGGFMDILIRFEKLHSEIIHSVSAIKTARELGHGAMLDTFLEDIPTLMYEHVKLMIECQQELPPADEFHFKNLSNGAHAAHDLNMGKI